MGLQPLLQVEVRKVVDELVDHVVSKATTNISCGVGVDSVPHHPSKHPLPMLPRISVGVRVAGGKAMANLPEQQHGLQRQGSLNRAVNGVVHVNYSESPGRSRSTSAAATPTRVVAIGGGASHSQKSAPVKDTSMAAWQASLRNSPPAMAGATGPGAFPRRYSSSSSRTAAAARRGRGPPQPHHITPFHTWYNLREPRQRQRREQQEAAQQPLQKDARERRASADAAPPRAVVVTDQVAPRRSTPSRQKYSLRTRDALPSSSSALAPVPTWGRHRSSSFEELHDASFQGLRHRNSPCSEITPESDDTGHSDRDWDADVHPESQRDQRDPGRMRGSSHTPAENGHHQTRSDKANSKVRSDDSDASGVSTRDAAHKTSVSQEVRADGQAQPGEEVKGCQCCTIM